MRRYETDSAKAVARILAHAVLADGVLTQTELDTLAHSAAARQLGLEGIAFDEVLRHYCEDLMMGSDYLDSVHLRLPAEVLAQLLDEVRDADSRRRLSAAIFDIVAADGIRTAEETALLMQIARHWGVSADAHTSPIRMT